MNEDLSVLGGRLREIRKKRGFTLQQLADKTGLTAGLLSKIENLRTSPSLPVLSDIARALGTDMAELFLPSDGKQGCRKWRYFPAGSFQPIAREDNFGFEYKLIFESRLSGDRQQVMLVEIAPGASREAVSGRVDYRIGDDIIDFGPGDVLFFDSSVPHVPENRRSGKAVMLAVYHLNEPVF